MFCKRKGRMKLTLPHFRGSPVSLLYPKLPTWELAGDLDMDARVLCGLRSGVERLVGSTLRSKCGSCPGGAPGGAALWVSLHRSPFLLLQVLALLRAPGLAGCRRLRRGAQSYWLLKSLTWDWSQYLRFASQGIRLVLMNYT